MTKIFVHGSGHGAASWQETISCMKTEETVLCPELRSLLGGKEASYDNLYASFVAFCSKAGGPIDLCGISLGGILALQYALNFPEKVKTLVLIGTPHKVPKVMFAVQNVVFKFLPKSAFRGMAFDKKDTFALGKTMKNLDFSNSAKELQCPALILCGEKDKANIKSAYYFAENMKNAELKLIENAGHVVNEENPNALAEILTEFYALHL